MTGRDNAAKEKIIAAAVDVLQTTDDPERVTVRELAEKAGVAVGAINYHFKSRDNLLNIAVSRIFTEAAEPWYSPTSHQETDPVSRLRRLIKDGARVAFRFRRLSTLTIRHGLLSGGFDVPELIVPLLREIFIGRESEQTLRLLAFQLIMTTQVAFLRADEFRRYSGVDLTDEKQRDAMIDALVDHLVPSQKSKQEGTTK